MREGLRFETDKLVCVDPKRIDEIWPHVSGFLASAFERGIGDDDLESLKQDLDARQSLLWVVWDGKGLLAAATTKLLKMPTKKLCVISACGGRELRRWRRFIAELESYAKAEGCDAFRMMGRPGWKAVFPDYREPWVCLEKGLK